MGEFSVFNMLKVLLKKIWLIIIISILCASLAFVYCSMIATPSYQARASVLGSNGNIATDLELADGTTDNSVQSNDLAASLSLTQTYEYMLTKMPTESQLFISRITEAGLVDYFNNSTVNVSAREDTFVIDITIISSDREVAKQIANIFVECAPEFISDYNIGVVKELSKARSATQVAPHTFITTAMAFILGAVATSLAVIYIAMSDRTINGEEDIKANYDVPVLGSVPDFQSTGKGAKYNG